MITPLDICDWLRLFMLRLVLLLRLIIIEFHRFSDLLIESLTSSFTLTLCLKGSGFTLYKRFRFGYGLVYYIKTLGYLSQRVVDFVQLCFQNCVYCCLINLIIASHISTIHLDKATLPKLILIFVFMLLVSVKVWIWRCVSSSGGSSRFRPRVITALILATTTTTLLWEDIISRFE